MSDTAPICPLVPDAPILEHSLNGPLKLTAKRHPIVDKFINEKKFVHDLIAAFGSPLNVVFPSIIADNIKGFTGLFCQRAVSGRIYVSAKANKSQALLTQVASGNAYIDVSSADQLRQALSAGFRPERISATGPKNKEYLALALRQRVLIIIDNHNELELLASMQSTSRSSQPADIMIRLRGYEDQPGKTSIFGIGQNQVQDLLSRLLYDAEHFCLIGFAWHATGVPDEMRVRSIGLCIEATIAAFDAGLKPRAINIGGGYRMNYLAKRQDWDGYISGLKASVLEQRVSLSWNNSGLGYRNEGGRLRGAPAFSDHYENVCGADHLAYILDQPISALDGMTTLAFLRDMMLDLYIEPGRAAYDQAGITLANVNFQKRTSTNEMLIGLDMNSSGVGASGNKLMTDPIVIPGDGRQAENEEGVFYIGNLCAPNDIITHHKTYPSVMPQNGDIVAFLNTGAYLMDFFESETLQQRTAQKIAVVESETGLSFYQDKAFDPYGIAE